MRNHTETDKQAPAANRSALNFTVIYEDVVSGEWARHFTDSLSEEIACACKYADSMWPVSSLENPLLASAALDASSDCDCVIVSLHGDRVIPLAARRWAEQLIARAAGRSICMIVLSDPLQGRRRVVDGTTHYFEALCAVNDVEFFSESTTRPEECDMPPGVSDPIENQDPNLN